MELLAALFTSLAVFAGVMALARRRRAPEGLEYRLGQLERGEPVERDDLLALPFATRVGSPLASKFAGLGRLLFPTTFVRGIERRLMLAGHPTTLSTFITAQLVLVAVAALLVWVSLASDNTIRVKAAMVGSAVVLTLIPMYWLRIRVAMRRRALIRALPDAVDLMVTTVEAGLSIDAALSEVGHETPGPLGIELRLAVRETALGRSRREALQRLMERTSTPELRSFLQALIQAEQTGIPIGHVLRIQAAQMRLRRRQAAEAAAQRAPVKMIFVMVTLVLPALLLFVMGPALMRMQDAI